MIFPGGFGPLVLYENVCVKRWLKPESPPVEIKAVGIECEAVRVPVAIFRGNKMKKSISIALMCLMLPVAGLSVSGCAVNKAMNQPDKKDVSVLDRGTPRYEVIGELGMPVDTQLSDDGKKIDVYSFTQGYSKGAKAARAFGHGVMDVATLGLWEVIGTPTEAIASGDKVVVRVFYDESELVDHVKALKGKEEL